MFNWNYNPGIGQPGYGDDYGQDDYSQQPDYGNYDYNQPQQQDYSQDYGQSQQPFQDYFNTQPQEYNTPAYNPPSNYGGGREGMNLPTMNDFFNRIDGGGGRSYIQPNYPEGGNSPFNFNNLTSQLRFPGQGQGGGQSWNSSPAGSENMTGWNSSEGKAGEEPAPFSGLSPMPGQAQQQPGLSPFPSSMLQVQQQAPASREWFDQPGAFGRQAAPDNAPEFAKNPQSNQDWLDRYFYFKKQEEGTYRPGMEYARFSPTGQIIGQRDPRTVNPPPPPPPPQFSPGMGNGQQNPQLAALARLLAGMGMGGGQPGNPYGPNQQRPGMPQQTYRPGGGGYAPRPNTYRPGAPRPNNYTPRPNTGGGGAGGNIRPGVPGNTPYQVPTRPTPYAPGYTPGGGQLVRNSQTGQWGIRNPNGQTAPITPNTYVGPWSPEVYNGQNAVPYQPVAPAPVAPTPAYVPGAPGVGPYAPPVSPSINVPTGYPTIPVPGDPWEDATGGGGGGKVQPKPE